jgi:hypothetical protein
MIKALLLTLFLIFVLLLGWNFFFPLLGGVILITAVVWSLAIASITVFCLALLLIFIFTGLGATVLGIILAIWTIIAILLFPVLFPILLPLFIVFLFVSYVLRKKRNKKDLHY